MPGVLVGRELAVIGDVPGGWVRAGLKLRLAATILVGSLLVACEGGRPEGSLLPVENAAFDDVATRVGLDFQHVNGASGHYYMPEIMGSGAALVDIDVDGDLDVYLVQGGRVTGHDRGPGARDGEVRDRLFLNLLAEQGELQFIDVTESSGIEADGYGMGVAVGDADGDGLPDLYVTNLGPDRLYINRGGGRFEDVTLAAGLGDPHWSTSAAFTDLDGDGDDDLYVCRYVDFRVALHKRCMNAGGREDYCAPDAYEPLSDKIYLNRGDGSFADASVTAGLATRRAAGLGVVVFDADQDGTRDVLVANDRMPNHLWIGRGDGSFDEVGLFAGVAVDAAGRVEASMGIDAADSDGDGDEDVILTHLRGETNTLYRATGQGHFVDRTLESGLGLPSVPLTGFGVAWIDWNHDSRLDLVVVNGAVVASRSVKGEGHLARYGEKDLLFRQDESGGFNAVGSWGGGEPLVSRGLATGDVDNDGDSDLVVTGNGGAVRLLLRRTADRRAWIGLELKDRFGGAPSTRGRVEILRSRSPAIWRRPRRDGSYLSSRDHRIVAALQGENEPVTLRVHWEDASVEEWVGLEPGRYHRLVRGEGADVR